MKRGVGVVAVVGVVVKGGSGCAVCGGLLFLFNFDFGT